MCLPRGCSSVDTFAPLSPSRVFNCWIFLIEADVWAIRTSVSSKNRSVNLHYTHQSQEIWIDTILFAHLSIDGCNANAIVGVCACARVRVFVSVCVWRSENNGPHCPHWDGISLVHCWVLQGSWPCPSGASASVPSHHRTPRLKAGTAMPHFTVLLMISTRVLMLL